jgi:hypothetical protein
MNKKIIVFLFAAFLTANYAQAQFSFGVRAGFNMTNLFNREGTKFQPGFHAGLVGDIAVGPAFSIQPAVLYATQGWKLETELVNGAVVLNYIQVPINLQYKVDLMGPKLLVQAGPYFGYGLGGKSKIGSLTTDIKMGGDEAYNAIDYGIVGGVGAQFGRIQIGINYLLGLADLNNTDLGDSVKNTGLSLSLTVLF